MNMVSDCDGSKITILPEEHGKIIINETGTAVHRVLCAVIQVPANMPTTE